MKLRCFSSPRCFHCSCSDPGMCCRTAEWDRYRTDHATWISMTQHYANPENLHFKLYYVLFSLFCESAFSSNWKDTLTSLKSFGVWRPYIATRRMHWHQSWISHRRPLAYQVPWRCIVLARSRRQLNNLMAAFFQDWKDACTLHLGIAEFRIAMNYTNIRHL